MAYPFILGIPISTSADPDSETETTPSVDETLDDTEKSQKTPTPTAKDAQPNGLPAPLEAQLDDSPRPPTSELDSSLTSASDPHDNGHDHTYKRPDSEPPVRNGGSEALPASSDQGDDLEAKTYRTKEGKRPLIDLTGSDDEFDSSSMLTRLRARIPLSFKEESSDLSDSESLVPPSTTRPVKPGLNGTEPNNLPPAVSPDTTKGTKRPSHQEPNSGAASPVLPPRKRCRTKKEPPPAIHKATVKELPTGTSAIPGAMDVDDNIIERIKKCLDRANHPNANEAETKAALHLASKLMGQHNITQAEVLGHKSPEEQAQCAGRGVVAIQRADGKDVKVPIRQFVGDLSSAMGIFFDCKSYSSSYRYRVHFIFYGIAQNAASAAMAFEWIYNLIVDWARYKKGIAATNSYCLGISNGLWRDARKEKDEELKRAKEAEAEALAKRLKEEELQRRKELERLQPTVEDEAEPESAPQPEPAEDPYRCPTPDIKLEDPESRIDPSHIVELCETSSESSASDLDDDLSLLDDSSELDDSSDEENDSDVYEADIVNDESDNESLHFDNDNDEIDHLAENTYKQESRSVSPPHRLPSPSSPVHIPSASPSPPKPVTPPREETPEAEPQWKSAMQLTIFRQTALKVAEDFLKSKNLKLRHRRRGATAKDPKAFKEGQKDSRKIDVRQKALEEKKDGEEL